MRDQRRGGGRRAAPRSARGRGRAAAPGAGSRWCQVPRCTWCTTPTWGMRAGPHGREERDAVEDLDDAVAPARGARAARRAAAVGTRPRRPPRRTTRTPSRSISPARPGTRPVWRATSTPGGREVPAHSWAACTSEPPASGSSRSRKASTWTRWIPERAARSAMARWTERGRGRRVGGAGHGGAARRAVHALRSHRRLPNLRTPVDALTDAPVCARAGPGAGHPDVRRGRRASSGRWRRIAGVARSTPATSSSSSSTTAASTARRRWPQRPPHRARPRRPGARAGRTTRARARRSGRGCWPRRPASGCSSTPTCASTSRTSCGASRRWSRAGPTSSTAPAPTPTARSPRRQPPHRVLSGRVYNLLLRRLGLTEERDTQCGMKGFTAAAAEAVFAPLRTARLRVRRGGAGPGRARPGGASRRCRSPGRTSRPAGCGRCATASPWATAAVAAGGEIGQEARRGRPAAVAGADGARTPSTRWRRSSGTTGGSGPSGRSSPTSCAARCRGRAAGRRRAAAPAGSSRTLGAARHRGRAWSSTRTRWPSPRRRSARPPARAGRRRGDVPVRDGGGGRGHRARRRGAPRRRRRRAPRAGSGRRRRPGGRGGARPTSGPGATTTCAWATAAATPDARSGEAAEAADLEVLRVTTSTAGSSPLGAAAPAHPAPAAAAGQRRGGQLREPRRQPAPRGWSPAWSAGPAAGSTCPLGLSILLVAASRRDQGRPG